MNIQSCFDVNIYFLFLDIKEIFSCINPLKRLEFFFEKIGIFFEKNWKFFEKRLEFLKKIKIFF